MIIVVPVATPVTMPLVVPIVATVVVPLLHVPPPGSVRVIVDPAHTAEGPTGSDGNGFIATGFVA